jgi:hypothetical protein
MKIDLNFENLTSVQNYRSLSSVTLGIIIFSLIETSSNQYWD